MRVAPSLLVICGFATAIPRIDAQPKPDAGAIMAAARKALGGEKRLSTVKSFSLTGRTRQVHGKNLVPIEFEMLCEPDRCARTDEGPAPEETARKARVTSVQQDDMRLTLGMFAGSFSGSPLTFSYAGQADMPQGKADVIDARGPDSFVARLFIDSTSRLPFMVSWVPSAAAVRPGAVMTGAARGAGADTQPGGPSPRQAGGAAMPQADTAATPHPSPPQGAQPGAPPARPVESRIYYEDYREVDGLRLPFRLRRAVGGETVEETIVERYWINPKIDPGRFEVRK